MLQRYVTGKLFRCCSWFAGLGLTVGWLAAAEPISLAKPPDLPVNPHVTCPEALEAHGRYTEHPGADVVIAPIPDLSWIEAMLPSLVEKVVRKGWCWPMPDASPTDRPSYEPGPNADRRSPEERKRDQELDRIHQAQRLYLLGVQYEQNGHFKKARTCFQEAHLLSPGTRYGRLAMDHLQTLERRMRHGVEEAEQPEGPGREESRSMNQDYQEMLRKTLPLGVVPVESH